MWNTFVQHLAFLLFIIASSSDLGFRLVEFLVEIVKGIDKFMGTILGMDYQTFWLVVFAIVGIVWVIFKIIDVSQKDRENKLLEGILKLLQTNLWRK